MSLNRQLIDTIKGHFAGKSTSQLEEIVRLHELDRWSEEALVAADEVLAERALGRAKEPRVPVKDAPPPSAEWCPGELLPVLGFAMGGLIGGLIAKFLVDPEGQPIDRPVSFGSNIAWLAAETTDRSAVATALGLRGLREATWKEGVAAAYRSSVFVTPPLGDWTLAVSTALFPPDDVATFVKPLLEQLSRQFQDAQYFCTHRDAQLHVWARARKGRLLRGYGWLGQQCRSVWNEGPQTKDERKYGIHSTAEMSTSVEHRRAEDQTSPDESCVLQLALLWSIDPTTLDEHFQEPVSGLLGEVRRE